MSIPTEFEVFLLIVYVSICWLLPIEMTNGFSNEFLNVIMAHIILPLIVLFIRFVVWLSGVKV